MLWFNESIRSLALHLDWEDGAYSIGKMLQVNQTLESLDFLVYGDDVDAKDSAIEIANSLQGSHLQKLRLCFEFLAIEIPDEVMEAFSKTIQTNNQLGKLVLTDTIKSRPLDQETRTKLRLNRLGVPRLLCDEAGSGPIHDSFVEAIVASRNDIHVLYNLLSSHPAICVGALEAPSSSETPPLKNASYNNGGSKTTISTTFPSARSNPESNKRKQTASKKVFGKRVLSFFAPSA